jgi:AcrR family transcriptional regulator
VPRDEKRRASILSAAAGAFAERGFAGTSMDDVAVAAGITRLVVYRHFPSKDALYIAVLERVSHRLAEEFAKEIATPVRTGRASVLALMRVGREDPAAFALLWRHAAREAEFADYAARFHQAIVGMVAEMLAAVDVGDRQRLQWAAEALVSYVVSAVLHWLDEGPPSGDDETVEQISASLPAIIEAWGKVHRRAVTGRTPAGASATPR